MFKNLTNFGFKRSAKQAIGFYLAYLVLLIIVGAVLGGIADVIVGNKDYAYAYAIGVKAGIILAFISVLAICFLILRKKKLLNNFGFILLALLSGLLALAFGALGGLIPTAYLTTRASKEIK